LCGLYSPLAIASAFIVAKRSGDSFKSCAWRVKFNVAFMNGFSVTVPPWLSLCFGVFVVCGAGIEQMPGQSGKKRFQLFRVFVSLRKSSPIAILDVFKRLRATRFDITDPGFRKASTLG
jgi:hypothetical protein